MMGTFSKESEWSWTIDLASVLEFEENEFEWYMLADMSIGDAVRIHEAKTSQWNDGEFSDRLEKFNEEYGWRIWSRYVPKKGRKRACYELVRVS